MATRADGPNSAQPVAGLSVFSQDARPLGRDWVKGLTRHEMEKAHLYVLSNCDELQPFFDQHMKEVQMESSDNLSEEQQKHFAEWFKQLVMSSRDKKSPEATDELYSLACGPDSMRSYPCCIVNGVCFWIRRDKRLMAPNPGLVVRGQHENELVDFYGFPTNVIELVYKFGHRVVLFCCEWFDTDPKKNKIEMDGGFTSINVSINSRWHDYDPFVLATQAQQVFYLDDHQFRTNWKLVQRVQHAEAESTKYDDYEKESNKNSGKSAQIPHNNCDGEQERVCTGPQRSTSMSSTTSTRREMREPNPLVMSLQAELENQRALTQSQKVELESRRALTLSQKAELESQRALTQSQKAELDSQRALTQNQKAELETQRALTESQQAELESQRLLTQCQQAELESTRKVVVSQQQLLQDQHQLLKDQQERLKQFEELVLSLHKNKDKGNNVSQSGSSFDTGRVDVAEVLARMSTYKRRRA